MKLKTTKEQRDELHDHWCSPSITNDLCHDADEAHRLEKELSVAWDNNRIIEKARLEEMAKRDTLAKEVADLRDKLDEAEYFKHRLKTIIPIFQEARDALTALTVTQVQLHGISLSLADRMDEAGTYNRENYDAEQRALKEQDKP